MVPRKISNTHARLATALCALTDFPPKYCTLILLCLPLVNRKLPSNMSITVKPHYNKDLGTMKIILLYQGIKEKEIHNKVSLYLVLTLILGWLNQYPSGIHVLNTCSLEFVTLYAILI